MGRFEQVWAGEREPRSSTAASTVATPDPPSVAAFRAWTAYLMNGIGSQPTVQRLNLRKLRLTEGFREALRQAPGEHAALFGIWDGAYRTLERLYWEASPPVLDPPPPPPDPTFEEIRRRYKAMKRERTRQAEAATIHWHPMEIDGGDPTN